MKIGICYDLKENYGCREFDIKHCNFNSESTIDKIKRHLQNCGFEVELLGDENRVLELYAKKQLNCDIYWPMVIGFKSDRNKQSFGPALFEKLQFPYIGTDSAGMSVAMDKIMTKRLAISLGIPTATFKIYAPYQELDFDDVNSYPKVIKPNCEGSSNGVKIINDKISLIREINILFNEYNGKVILEDYLSGNDITVSIIERSNKPIILGMVETVLDNEQYNIYNSEFKHLKKCQKRIPKIDNCIYQKICEYAIDIFKCIGCRDYARIDFKLDKNNNPYLLEVTPHPMLPNSASYMIAATFNKMTVEDVYSDIVKSAVTRYRKKGYNI